MFQYFLIVLVLAVPGAFAADTVNHDEILGLLKAEKMLVQGKDADGLRGLYTRDFQHIGKNGVALALDEYLASVVAVFMNVSKILYKPEIVSEKISDDGKSATVAMKSETKYLIETGRRPQVVTTRSTVEASVVIEDGVLKYKSAREIEQEGRAP